MVLLEDQHGPEANGADSASTNVDTDALGLAEELVTLGGIPGNEGSLALTTEVLQMLGVLLSKALETRVQVFTGLGGVLDEVQALDLLNDTTEDEGTSGVTHPGVELTVRLVGTQGGVTVVVTGGLGLLREGHHVGRGLEVPVVVGPELACSSNTGLHLIDDEENVVTLGDLAQAAEEGRRGVVVSTLGLDGLDNDGGDRVVPFLDQTLGLLEAALFLLGVLLSMLFKWVLEGGERRLGPVEGRDVELVDGLTAGGGQTAKETAVESRLEGHDRQLWGAWRLVVHGSLQFLLSELLLGTSTLQLTVVHESGFVGSLVGVRSGHGGEDLVQALGGDLEDTSVQDVSPVSRGEVAQGWSVDQRGSHLGRLSDFGEMGVVVANRDRSNLSVASDGHQP